MIDKLKEILNLFPKSKDDKIDWNLLKKTTLSPIFLKMAETQQNPEYHSEGDVYTHTKMVCESLISDNEYWELTAKEREILFLASLLHDIGKIKCSKLEDGKIVSPRHAKTGAVMARELLWREYGLCGTKEKQNMRESVCAFIKYHSYPPFAITNNNPNHKMLKVSYQVKLATCFSIRKLCILERADVKGRIGASVSDYFEKIEYCRLLGEELGCLDKPYSFPNAYTARAYFKNDSIQPNYEAFNDTWGEVILLSGLPGTGKDTFIKNNYPSVPVITLDQIRIEKGLSPVGNQSEVVSIAKERAREHLRRKQSFIWNATSINEQLRSALISLFESYGARVKIVFLETEYQEQLRRNSSRKSEVPTQAIEKMLSRLEIPEANEAQAVEWIIT